MVQSTTYECFLFPAEAAEFCGRMEAHFSLFPKVPLCLSSSVSAEEMAEKTEQKAEKETEQKTEQETEEGKIILGVWIHCLGCEASVKKCLKGFSGVESVEVDSVKNKVTVKGEKTDPVKIAERVRKITGKHVDLISPIPSKDEKKDEKDDEEKKEPKIEEVNMKIYLHCEGCAKDLKSCIHKMQGVHTVEADMEKNLVKVKGAFDAETLLQHVMKRSGKHAEIVKPDERPNDKDQAKNNGGEEDGEKQKEKEDGEMKMEVRVKMSCCFDDVRREHVYAPQIFSDENPNACCVM